MFDILELSQDLALAAQTGRDKSILVAGQALAFWGAYYLDDDSPTTYKEALASHDIDFLERRIERVKIYVENIKIVAQQYGGFLAPPKYPSLNDSTFQTALLEITIPSLERPIIVDFLDSITGLNDKEVLAGADKIIIAGKEFPILNPCLCLKARIHNLLVLYPSLGNQEKIKVEHIRVKAAIEIVRCYLMDVIRQKGERHGHGKAKVLIKLAKQSMSKKLYREYGINITDCFISVGFDQRFIDKTVTLLSMKVQEGW